jgi:hypothetical protein
LKAQDGRTTAGEVHECPKVLNSSEDAHTKTMSTFEADEHLQGWDASPSSPEIRQQLSAIGMKADLRFRRFKVRF